MITEWRYHFLGGPLNGRHIATKEQAIHDDHGLVDFPPTNEDWIKYREAAAAVKPGEQPPEMPPRVEYRITYSETLMPGDEAIADFYLVPAKYAPSHDVGFLCRLAMFHIDKLNDAKRAK